MKILGTILSIIGALAVIVAVAAAAYFFGGFYNVAASQGDPWFVKEALEKVREASINRYATDTPPPDVVSGDQATVQAGARAYATRGCVYCHGIPGGTGWSKFSEGLSPDAADLTKEVRELTPGQIFWVVKNGINMTGMPSFGRTEVPDNEIWKIAAFVKKFPDLTEADYKAWTADTAAPAEPPK